MIRALGVLDVLVGEDHPLLGGPRARAVLARLVVAYPASAALDQLIEAIWGDTSPQQAATTVQVYVSRLRKAVGPSVQIVGRQGGYRLQADAVDLDWALLRRETTEAVRAAAAGRHGEVVAHLQPLVPLWRSSPPLQPFADESWAAPFCDDLERLHLHATELLATAYLVAGSPELATDLLESGLTDHPLSESTAELLMLASYRVGRQAHALEVYRAITARLDDELGIEPSTRLTDTFVRILRQDPSLDAGPSATTSARILPPRPVLLVGREPELQLVSDLLARTGRAVVHGLAGVGKSSLAAELAHRHPGLVCWVPAENASGREALTELASRLGVSPLLAESDLLSSLWRVLQQHPGWMLIFDDASDFDAIGRWLPPLTDGAVLVTSRNPAWSGFAGTHHLQPLSRAASIEFVSRRAGRATGDRTALAEVLGGVTLALEQACRYIDETGMSIERYLQLFERHQLDLLNRGAPSTHPQPVAATWDMLIAEVWQRSGLAIRVLEVASFLGGELPFDLLSAFVGVETSNDLELEEALGALVQASMVDRGTTTLRMHPLVQEVVRSRLDAEQLRCRALEAARMLSAHVPQEVDPGRQRHAWSALIPHVFALVGAVLETGRSLEEVVVLGTECCWYLRSRQANESAKELCSLLTAMVGEPGPAHAAAAELLACRADLLDLDGHLRPAMQMLGRAQAVLTRLADPPTLTAARVGSLHGHLLNCSDHPQEAIAAYERAAQLFAALDRPVESAVAAIGLGYSRWSARDYAGAEETFRAVLHQLDGSGWQRHPLRVEAVSGLAMMLHEQGAVTEAIALQTRALADAVAIYGAADHASIAYIHDKLGFELGLVARHAESRRHHECAAAMLQRLYGPNDPRMAMAISNRGLAEVASGDSDAARASQQQALAILLDAYGKDHRDTRLVAQRLGAL